MITTRWIMERYGKEGCRAFFGMDADAIGGSLFRPVISELMEQLFPDPDVSTLSITQLHVTTLPAST
jgi:hypothetical protein